MNKIMTQKACEHMLFPQETKRQKTKKDWKKYILPQKGEKKNIHEEIDNIVYAIQK